MLLLPTRLCPQLRWVYLLVALTLTAGCLPIPTPLPPTATLVPTITPRPPTATPAPSPTPRPSPTPSPSPSPTPPTSPGATPESDVPIYTYRVVATYPHDPTAFTQGLVIQGGVLYEGTGLYGRSTLRRVELVTGEIQQMVHLPAEVFGEGIAIFEGRIYQLTWQSRIGFIYDQATFERLGDFTYPTEGWGITTDGRRLIMSDGTATLHFWDTQTLVELGQVEVRDPAGPIAWLNELEYVDGEVWANVWPTDRIARIDPASGRVTGWIDLSGLLSAEEVTEPVDVLNGIAYNAETGRLFVTGKLWPKLFEIEVLPAEGAALR